MEKTYGLQIEIPSVDFRRTYWFPTEEIRREFEKRAVYTFNGVKLTYLIKKRDLYEE